ncbi:MAG: type II CAAX prenyl endopeptidase Rce1 family protein [Candidatus Hermodarchaeota archaeon]
MNMNEEEHKENIFLSKKGWTFCPSCGYKLPEIDRQKFCIKCGVDLEYIESNIISYQPSPYDASTYPYRPEREKKKIADEDILNLKEKQIWGSFYSIGIPIVAYILMISLGLVIMAFILSLVGNLEDLMALMLNPYFIILLSFTELIFIFVPVYYVGKYLQNPTFNNRLALLGFTFKGKDNFKAIKEVFIGLGFAIVGIFLVFSVSFLIEIILELIFGVDIVFTGGGSLNEIDLILANSDILALIFLSITMILIIGTSEELLFRGFMQKGLVRTVGKYGGIIITALIFSSIHLIGIFQMGDATLTEYLISFLLNFFPYFAISLLLGFIFYWRKENLIAVMITHGFYDALTIIIAYIYFSFI